jgi:putative membrane protein
LLPFGLVDSIGLLTPVVVGWWHIPFSDSMPSATEIEEPFGYTPNDLPLTAVM